MIAHKIEILQLFIHFSWMDHECNIKFISFSSFYGNVEVKVPRCFRKQRGEKKRSFTKSARGITTRFSLRRRENALDLRIPNAQKKSSSVIGNGKSFLLGSMISSSSLRNSLRTYSFTASVVLRS